MFEQLIADPPELPGRLVRMEPLGPQHLDGLWEAAQDERIWTWLPYRMPENRDRFAALIEEAFANRAAGCEVPYATVDAGSGAPVGSTRYLNLRPEHRGLEIGWTWLSPAVWSAGRNAEAKLLMMRYAFEELGCMRVEFKTDARNERSRAALAALPAHYEGISRKHMLVQGGMVRDSAWYAVTDEDWPAVAAALEARIDAAVAA
jgi:RimJ/RimL family protein N-acetyltransferase